MIFIMKVLNLLSVKKILARLTRKIICALMYCCEYELTYSVYVSHQKFKNCMHLLLITDENKSHYAYIKDFNRFMCDVNKTFANVVCNVLVVKKF